MSIKDIIHEVSDLQFFNIQKYSNDNFVKAIHLQVYLWLLRLFMLP